MTRCKTRTVLLALLLVAVASSSPTLFGADARAQETARNDQLLVRFVLDCLEDHTNADTIAVVLPATMAFAGADFAAALVAKGQTVWIESSTEAARAKENAATIETQIDEAGVRYQRRGRRDLARDVFFHARYIVRDPDGSVAAADRCDASHSDVISRSDVPAVELEAFPMTQGTVPGVSRARRYVAPVVAGAAAAVSAYLLFSLRSDSGS